MNEYTVTVRVYDEFTHESHIEHFQCIASDYGHAEEQADDHFNTSYRIEKIEYNGIWVERNL